MSAHLVMEKSKGLYHRVILESGAFSQVQHVALASYADITIDLGYLFFKIVGRSYNELCGERIPEFA